ncbi:MAG: nitronate monooxygenase [Pseudomonadota bacterium]
MERRFKTRITKMLGIRHPILIGGMMWLGRAELVAAVVRAGATGFISALTFAERSALRDEINKCRELAESDRFGVNLYISNRPEAAERLLPLLDVVCELEVPFVETSGAKPSLLLPQLKQEGIKVIHKVPAVRYGLSAEKAGVDAIILVGAECGGHPGHMMIGTMIQGGLGPTSLSVPVILGGGIGRGSQLAAALAMGCEGVLMGTRLMVAEEAVPHRDFKARVVESDGTDSVVVQTTFRNHHRVLRNETTDEILALEAQGVDEIEPYLPLISGEISWQALQSGDFRRGTIDFGQAACFADQVEPAAQIIARIVTDAEQSVAALESRLSLLQEDRP